MEDLEQTGEPATVPVEQPAAPPSLVDNEEHPVDPRSVKATRIITLPLMPLPPILLLAFCTVGWALGGIPSVVYLPLAAGLLLILASVIWIAYRWPAVRYDRLRYLVHKGGLRIRRGVFWRKTIWIAMSRVQHTDVSQGPLQRKFELATLTVHTAGTAGASISLSGLENGIATRLSNHLRPDRSVDAN